MTPRSRYLNFLRRDPRAEAREEVEFHLAMRVRDLERQGLPPEEAQRRAEQEFGDALSVQNEVAKIDARMRRREDRSVWWSDMGRDLRLASRSLLRHPAYSVTAIVCAALGIGMTAAILSAAYAILVRPLPFPDAERLVAVYGENTIHEYRGTNISWGDYRSWREDSRTLEGLGIWSSWSFTFTEGVGGAERVDGAVIAPDLFHILGIQPARGRSFLPDEDQPGRDRVVLLSDDLWRARFGGDPSLVGQQVRIDGQPYTVVGIMPAGFAFPDRGRLWVPYTQPANPSHGNRSNAGAIGRLRQGVTLEQATADLHRVDARLVEQFPEENRGWRADVYSLRDDLVGNLQRPLQVFVLAVALVLLLVCANLANLALARGTLRSRELAVRSALGAWRGRLTRQLFTESMLLALAGGAAGVLVAWLGVRLLRSGFPDALPPYFVDLHLDGRTLLFVLVVTLLTGALFGTLPALRGARVDIGAALRDGGVRAGGGHGAARLRSALVVGEVALSVALLIGATLLIRSYRNLAGTDLGFQERGIMTVRVPLPDERYTSAASRKAFFDRLLESARTLPGVTLAGTADGIPFSGFDWKTWMHVVGTPPPEPGEEIDSHIQWTSPDFFRVIGVPLVRGRWFTAADRDTVAPPALVNELFVARSFEPGTDPIGQRVEVGLGYQPVTIVGVIGDYRHYGLPTPMGPALYLPYAAASRPEQFVVLQTSLDEPASLVPALRRILQTLDSDVALYEVRTMEEAVSRSISRQRLQSNVLTIFAALALILTCIGLYGVISYAVAQRTREMGVRIALGAKRGDVVRLVLAYGGRLVALGTVIGVMSAAVGVRLLTSLLYEVRPFDVGTFTAVPVLLAVVAVAAALIPALRAMRVNPAVAMRGE